MRKVFVVVVALVAVLVGGLLTAPFFIDWESWKPEIARGLAAATGRTVTIEGKLSLSLLPVPSATARGVRIANAEGAASPDFARLGALDVRLAVAPLLSGRIVATSLRLVEPTVELQRLPDGRGNWQGLGPAADEARPASTGRAAVAVEKLEIVRGTLVWRAGEQVERVEAIEASAALDGLEGPYRAKGTARWHGMPIAFETELGRLGEARVPVRLIADARGAGKLEAAFDVAGNSVTGQASLAGEDLSLLLALAGAEAEWAKARGYSIAGKLDGTTDALSGKELAFALDEVRGTGSLRVVPGSPALVDVSLALGAIDLDKWLAPRNVGPAAAKGEFSLPTGLRLRLDAASDIVAWRGQTIRQARFEAVLENGALRIARAAALLPGGTDASLGGTLAASAGAPRLTGSVELVSDNLRGLLDWVGVQLPPLPQERLRRASVLARFTASPDRIEIASLDLSADASRLTGAATLLLRDRVAIGARLALDQLNLDAYLPEEASAPSGGNAAAPEALVAAAAALDANLDASVEALTFRGQAMSGIHLAALAQRGEVTLREGSVRDVAGAAVKLSGRLGPLGSGRPTLQLTAEAKGPALDRLLRVAAPGARLAALPLGAFQLEAQAGGSLDGVTLEASLAALGGRTSVKGKADIAGATDLTLDGSHPSAGRLSSLLGYRMRGDPGEMRWHVRVRGSPARVALDELSLDAGKLRLAGKGQLDLSAPRPRLTGELSFGELTVDAFLPARQSAAAAPRVQLAQAGGRAALPDAERWSREPIDLAWLNRFDADMQLRGERLDYQNWRLDAPAARIDLHEGTLALRGVEAGLFGGNLAAEASVAGAQRALALTARLRDTDLGRVGFSARFDGKADLDLDLAAAGASPWELVSALRGNARFAARDGTIAGVDLGAVSQRLHNIDRLTDLVDLVRGASGGETAYRTLAGTFRVERGVARSDDIELDAEAADGTATVTVDLPRWLLQSRATLNLREHPKAPPLTMILEGPLDQPRRSFDTRELQKFLTERGMERLLRPRGDGAAGAPEQILRELFRLR